MTPRPMDPAEEAELDVSVWQPESNKQAPSVSGHPIIWYVLRGEDVARQEAGLAAEYTA